MPFPDPQKILKYPSKEALIAYVNELRLALLSVITTKSEPVKTIHIGDLHDDRNIAQFLFQCSELVKEIDDENKAKLTTCMEAGIEGMFSIPDMRDKLLETEQQFVRDKLNKHHFLKFANRLRLAIQVFAIQNNNTKLISVCNAHIQTMEQLALFLFAARDFLPQKNSKKRNIFDGLLSSAIEIFKQLSKIIEEEMNWELFILRHLQEKIEEKEEKQTSIFNIHKNEIIYAQRQIKAIRKSIEDDSELTDHASELAEIEKKKLITSDKTTVLAEKQGYLNKKILQLRCERLKNNLAKNYHSYSEYEIKAILKRFVNIEILQDFIDNLVFEEKKIFRVLMEEKLELLENNRSNFYAKSDNNVVLEWYKNVYSYSSHVVKGNGELQSSKKFHSQTENLTDNNLQFDANEQSAIEEEIEKYLEEEGVSSKKNKSQPVQSPTESSLLKEKRKQMEEKENYSDPFAFAELEAQLKYFLTDIWDFDGIKALCREHVRKLCLKEKKSYMETAFRKGMDRLEEMVRNLIKVFDNVSNFIDGFPGGDINSTHSVLIISAGQLVSSLKKQNPVKVVQEEIDPKKMEEDFRAVEGILNDMTAKLFNLHKPKLSFFSNLSKWKLAAFIGLGIFIALLLTTIIILSSGTATPLILGTAIALKVGADAVSLSTAIAVGYTTLLSSAAIVGAVIGGVIKKFVDAIFDWLRGEKKSLPIIKDINDAKFDKTDTDQKNSTAFLRRTLDASNAQTASPTPKPTMERRASDPIQIPQDYAASPHIQFSVASQSPYPALQQQTPPPQPPKRFGKNCCTLI